MSRIKGKNTKPELLVRKFLHNSGFRYRIHVNNLSGKPDIVLPKYKTIIFIHGCFWHCHENCKYFVRPKSNESYWIPKLKTNVLRDQKNESELTNLGWSVIKVWECELKKDKIDDLKAKLLDLIRGGH